MIKTAMYMALHREIIDDDTVAILRDSFENVKTNDSKLSDGRAERQWTYAHPSAKRKG